MKESIKAIEQEQKLMFMNTSDLDAKENTHVELSRPSVGKEVDEHGWHERIHGLPHGRIQGRHGRRHGWDERIHKCHGRRHRRIHGCHGRIRGTAVPWVAQMPCEKAWVPMMSIISMLLMKRRQRLKMQVKAMKTMKFEWLCFVL